MDRLRSTVTTSSGRWILSVVVVLAFNTWVLAPFVDGHQILSQGLLSELAADDRPASWVFRGGDALTGTAVLLISLLDPKNWSRRVLAIAGAMLLGDSLFNLECSPAASAGCTQGTNFFQQSWRLQAHTAMSVTFSLALMLSMVLIRRAPWNWLNLAIQVAVNAVLAVCDLTGRPHHTWLQVISVVSATAWFVHLALTLGKVRDQPHLVQVT